MNADADIWSTHRDSTYPWEPKPSLADPTSASLTRLAVNVPLLLAGALHTANRTLAAWNDLVERMSDRGSRRPIRPDVQRRADAT